MKIITLVLTVILICNVLLAKPKSVTLLFPKGGESFRAGSSQNIKWDTTGTLGASWTFQFGTSKEGPWTNLQGAVNKLDSAKNRGTLDGGFRVPAVKSNSGYLRMVYNNPDGTLDNSLFSVNDVPFSIEQPEATRADSILRDAITSKIKLSSNKIYALDGYLYVDEGAELHIEAGTIIIGDTVGQNSAICVNRGGKIFAQGTNEKPIVFTSSAKPNQRRGGDWGGILICGKASTNHPGGEAALEGGIADQTTKRGFFGGGLTPDDYDNSGILEYIRIEFAGIAAAPNQELNSLTLGAVGKGTKINHIQISYANDDAIEWFGGTVDVKYISIIGTLDDDLDCDNGYNGRVQFGIIQRFKDRADVSTSETFEIDNNSSGSFAQPYTSPIFSNITTIGPIQDTSWVSSSTGVAEGTFHTRFGAAAQIRRNARASIFNSLIVGWNRGIELLSEPTQFAALNDSLMFKNNSLYGIKGDVLRKDGQNSDINIEWLANQSNNNNIDVSDPHNSRLTNPFLIGLGFNPVPSNSSNDLNNAKYDNGNTIVNINDDFFDKVNYRGAFSTDITKRWDLPWCEYDPINKEYITSINEAYVWNLEVNVFPNPTSNSIKISYQIPVDDFVTITLFDNNGRIVDTFLQNTFQSQGFYEFSINVNKLHNGLYLLKLQTKSNVIIKKISVIK
ncbi:MAG TPA: T9SS type A sorting domain-containing protein [Candidatus Kapabacteria bacterium]|nr:T9SS type A sorting domain-containing protein [Candidatus Kapabacteria bacterium]